MTSAILLQERKDKGCNKNLYIVVEKDKELWRITLMLKYRNEDICLHIAEGMNLEEVFFITKAKIKFFAGYTIKTVE